MITEDRLKHIIGVARRCYEIAGDMGFADDFRKRMFVLGFLHDIGYEFSDNVGHAAVGAEILSKMRIPYSDAVADHGKPLPAIRQPTALRILNRADIETSASGERITATQRLEGVEKRYGRDSVQYANMKRLCDELRLI